MFTRWLIVIILLLIWYIYTIQYSNTNYPKFFLDDINPLFKTGDIILFKASNNFNSIFINSYYGHIGIIYVGVDGIPMIFEANGIEHMPLREHHPKTGIFLTPAVDRIKKYKGRCYLKQLDTPLDTHATADFKTFIDYCLNNFKYDTKVISSGLKKYFGYKKCDSETNCGDLVFLSLIKLGLLPIEEYDNPRLHHLKYVAGLTKLNGNSYTEPVEIIDHPFAE